MSIPRIGLGAERVRATVLALVLIDLPITPDSSSYKRYRTGL